MKADHIYANFVLHQLVKLNSIFRARLKFVLPAFGIYLRLPAIRSCSTISDGYVRCSSTNISVPIDKRGRPPADDPTDCLASRPGDYPDCP